MGSNHDTSEKKEEQTAASAVGWHWVQSFFKINSQAVIRLISHHNQMSQQSITMDTLFKLRFISVVHVIQVIEKQTPFQYYTFISLAKDNGTEIDTKANM